MSDNHDASAQMASFLSKGTAMSVPPLNPRASISNACMPVPLRSNWTFTPSADGSDENLLIMLHGMGDGPGKISAARDHKRAIMTLAVNISGRGGRLESVHRHAWLRQAVWSAENFVKLAMKMALPGTASLALKAPLQLPAGVQGGTIWFSTMTSDWTPLAVRWQSANEFCTLLPQAGSSACHVQASDVLPSFVQCMQLLRELLHALHEKAGWPFSRMHLLGFSQGGTACLGLTRWLRWPTLDQWHSQ